MTQYRIVAQTQSPEFTANGGPYCIQWSKVLERWGFVTNEPRLEGGHIVSLDPLEFKTYKEAYDYMQELMITDLQEEWFVVHGPLE